MFFPDLETRRLLVQERQAQLRQEARGVPVGLSRQAGTPTKRRRVLRRRLRVA